MNFNFLSDLDLKVHKAYYALGEKWQNGQKILMLTRNTYFLDESLNLKKILVKTRVKGHVQAVLSELNKIAVQNQELFCLTVFAR